jgi:hypothetical protein
MERLRFVQCTVSRGRLGRAQAEVTLDWASRGLSIVGRAEGDAGPAGDLRVVAEATLDAVAQAAEKRIRFDLLGAKIVRAFDATLAIVALRCRIDEPGADGEAGDGRRVVGAVLVDRDEPTGAALAVLDATNRIIGVRE